jgi:hypothetical protein
LADARSDVHFVGRLATYRYYNMDQIVAQALTEYGKIIGMKRKEAAVVTKPVEKAISVTASLIKGGNGRKNKRQRQINLSSQLTALKQSRAVF